MTNRRRNLISAAILAACVCVALVVLAMLPPRPGVTKANFDRIEQGMTEAEVKAILGGPPRYFVHTNEGLRVGEGWVGPDGSEAFVDVSGDALVTEKQWVPSNETIADKLRRWLHPPWW